MCFSYELIFLHTKIIFMPINYLVKLHRFSILEFNCSSVENVTIYNFEHEQLLVTTESIIFPTMRSSKPFVFETNVINFSQCVLVFRVFASNNLNSKRHTFIELKTPLMFLTAVASINIFPGI